MNEKSGTGNITFKIMLPLSSMSVIATIILGFFSSVVLNAENTITYSVIAIVSITFMMNGLIFYFIFRRFVSKPIKRTSSLMEYISKGKGDLTKRLDVFSNDEIGALAHFFNEFILSLNKLVSQIKIVTDKAETISRDLAAASEDSLGMLEDIQTNIEKLKNDSVHLDKETDLSHGSAEEVKSFINNLNTQISSQASAVNESSASIEEMSASIQNIAKSSEEKLKIVHELEKTASTGEEEMKDSMNIIQKVADSAHLIMEMISVINGIAEQTNLLAMNAAIEAAHAGDAGKGFAVVADEIRKLAEDTGKNSKEISNSLKEVIDFIHVSKESTGKTSQSFIKIVDGVKEVANSMLEMKTAMQEQAVGSTQIISSLGSLVKITEEVKSSSHEIDEKTGKITSSMESISLITTDIRNRMEESAKAVSGLYKSVVDVLQTEIRSSDNVFELEELVKKFKIDENHSTASGVQVTN